MNKNLFTELLPFLFLKYISLCYNGKVLKFCIYMYIQNSKETYKINGLILTWIFFVAEPLNLFSFPQTIKCWGICDCLGNSIDPFMNNLKFAIIKLLLFKLHVGCVFMFFLTKQISFNICKLTKFCCYIFYLFMLILFLLQVVVESVKDLFLIHLKFFKNNLQHVIRKSSSGASSSIFRHTFLVQFRTKYII